MPERRTSVPLRSGTRIQPSQYLDSTADEIRECWYRSGRIHRVDGGADVDFEYEMATTDMAKLESEGGRGQRRLLRLSQAFDEEQISPRKNG
ncbi:hypothetical protein OROHE_009676 [Orobanche hederae]